jgi:hypothetical protein
MFPSFLNSLDGNKYGKPEAVAWEFPFRKTFFGQHSWTLESNVNIQIESVYFLSTQQILDHIPSIT